MRSTAVRFICRVLVAVIALYAANDGLLQAYMHDEADGIVRQMPARATMPALAAASSDDDRDRLASSDAPLLPAPSPDGSAQRFAHVVAPTLPPVPPTRSGPRERPRARAPPSILHAQA